MSSSDLSNSFFLGEWRIEPALNRISRGDEVVKVDPRNMDVLLQLAARPGEVVSQTEIERNVWDNVIVTSRCIGASRS